MSTININFNDNNYEIGESTLSGARTDFVSRLGAIAGSGLKIVVDGVVYNVDPTKLNGAIISLEAVLNNLNAGGGDAPTDGLIPGLYQTGAIALYEEQGAKAIESMMITPWDQLLADGVVHVEDGVVYSNFNMDEWANASSDALVGDLVLPEDGSITSIGNMDNDEWVGTIAFSSCYELTGLYIPSSVTKITDYAYDSCEALTTVVFGRDSKLETIGYQAFCCTGLTSISIPDSVTSIGNYAFNVCESLTSIEIPDSVTSIGNYAFERCSSLTSVTIGNGVTSIGENAFTGCSITSITIPDSVTSIGWAAFGGCSSLTSVTIGNGVTSTGEGAFADCSSLTSIEIPDNVTSIGAAAFSGCSSLTSIKIPNSVTSIGNYAFERCSSLTSIVFEGTMSEWNAIEKLELFRKWNEDIPATYIQCTDGQASLVTEN